MGPAVRAAAADAARQILEIAAQSFDLEERVLVAPRRPGRLGRRRVLAARGDHGPARGRADHSAKARAGRTRPGCACSPSASRSRTSPSTSRRRGDGRADRGDPRRRPRDQPAGRPEPGRGRDHPGRRPHALARSAWSTRPAARCSRRRSTPTSCRRSPTCRRSWSSFLDIPDEHLTNLGSKGLGEPPIVPTAAAIVNAIRDATGADVRSLPVGREEMLRALAEAREREKLATAPA